MIDHLVIQKIAKALEANNVDLLLLVGSFAYDPNTASDIDFLLLSKETLLDKQIVLTAFNQLDARDCRESDDAVQAIVDCQPVSIAVLSLEEIATRISNLALGKGVEGERRFWAAGLRFPETFCGDIVSAISIIDQKQLLVTIQSKLNPYPLLMRRSIIEYCQLELQAKTKAIRSRGATRDVYARVLLADILLALVRIAAASEYYYFPGLKHLDRLDNRLGSQGLAYLRLAQELSDHFDPPKLLSRVLKLGYQTIE